MDDDRDPAPPPADLTRPVGTVLERLLAVVGALVVGVLRGLLLGFGRALGLLPDAPDPKDEPPTS